jgi:hypothetical protein
MSSDSTGKIAFVKALDLLPVGHIEFIKALSKVRNIVAHSAQNLGFDLVEHFKSVTAKKSPRDVEKLTDTWSFGTSVSGEKSPPEALARWIMTVTTKGPLPKEIKLSRRALFLIHKPKVTILWSALQILDAIAICNWYGPQIWRFFMHMHPDERKECEEWVHEVFGKAKVGDPELPERIAQKFERLNPGVRIRRDDDGQPNLQSLAAAWSVETKRRIKEDAEKD